MHECRVRMRDGARLFLRCIEPQTARASVLLVHGMGEHSSRYLHVAERLAQNGFRVCLFDLRGHGRSDGRRGHVENYAQLLDDIAAVENEIARDGSPIFLYGHSLGGQLVINFVIDRKSAAHGVIAASPWFALAFMPRAWKLWLAQLAVRIWPQFTQQTDVRPERLSRDQAFLQSMPDLELVHHTMSAHMYFELVRGAARARECAEKFNLPLLLIQGGDDPITSAAATRAFFEKAKCPDKTLRIYPGGLHETHNDLDREIVLRDVLYWLDARAPQLTTRDASASDTTSTSAG